MKKKDVIKHSAVIQMSNEITLLQRRAWNWLLANAYDDLPNKEKFIVSEDELLKCLGLGRNNQEYLKDTLKELTKTAIEFNLLGIDKKYSWGSSVLLADIFLDNDGNYIYSYGAILREQLHNPSIYTRVSLSIEANLSSSYSLALYELFLSYFIKGQQKGMTPFIKIDDFKKLMGIKKDEYEDFKELNRRVIKEPIEEINRKTPLFIEVEYKREGRKIVALCFHIQPNPNREPIQESPKALLESLTKKEEIQPKEVVNEDLISKWAAVKVPRNVAIRLLKEYPEEQKHLDIISYMVSFPDAINYPSKYAEKLLKSGLEQTSILFPKEAKKVIQEIEEAKKKKIKQEEELRKKQEEKNRYLSMDKKGKFNYLLGKHNLLHMMYDISGKSNIVFSLVEKHIFNIYLPFEKLSDGVLKVAEEFNKM